MKRLIIAIILVICTITVNAQQWSVTPEVGMTAVKRGDPEYLNLSSMHGGWVARWKMGAAVEYAFKPGWFALKSGLYYTTRGHASNTVISGIETGAVDNKALLSSKVTRHFLQMPLMADFSFKLSDDVRLHLAAGPYLALSLGEKEKCYYTGYNVADGGYYGGYYGTTVPYPASGYDYNRLDWGVSLQAGIDVRQWVINVGYDASLGKENRHGWDVVDTKYQTISLSVGYKFKLGK